MTTRIEAGGPSTGVHSTPTAARVTPPPARPFKQMVGAGAAAVVEGAENAVRRLPGGPILAAAVRNPSAAAPMPAGARPEGPTGTAPSDGIGGEPSIEGALARHADQNLYYLELQERINAETRAYTTMSNVLKARHDTVKNAINNIR